MWQTDFKSEFRMADRNCCYPLDILDDYSRFCIQTLPQLSAANVVISTFSAAFLEFCMPNSILPGNGAQFAGFKKGYTQFEKWLMELDILPIHGWVKHPQTQDKIERFHRTMKQELLSHAEIANIDNTRKKYAVWREKYNNEQPHEALRMKRPADVYEPSGREYKGKIEEFEYGGQYHVVKVNSWGHARFDKCKIYLSETMIGQYIEFRPSANGETFIACYRDFKIAEFDTSDGHLICRSIAKL